MEILNLNYDDLKSNCYLLKIEDKRYLIDASINLDILKKYTVKLDGILITHGHADHIINLKELYDYYKCNVYCHKNAIEKIEDNKKNYASMFRFNGSLKIDKYSIVHDGDTIDGLFKILETPGHTSCSVIYLVGDVMFSGDTLFKGSVGRTDLYSGNISDLFKSLKKISNLKINYDIYPGHDEKTNLVDEKRNNFYMLKVLE